MKRPILRKIRIEEGESIQVKHRKYFQKHHGKKFQNLKKEVHIKRRCLSE